jgi:hypothetical protein
MSPASAALLADVRALMRGVAGGGSVAAVSSQW